MATRGAPSLTLTDAVVLALIVEGPRHGFSVARELREDGPIGQVWTVAPPLVYRAIERLEASELIERVGTEPGSKGPVRTVFRPTRRGRAAARAWLGEPVAHPREFRTAFIVKLLLSARLGLSIESLVTLQRAIFESVLAGLAGKADEALGPERIVARWRLENVRAMVGFLGTIAPQGSSKDS